MLSGCHGPRVLAPVLATAGRAGLRLAQAGDLPRFTALGSMAVRSGDGWADRAPEVLPGLARLMAAGQLTVPVWRSYPLAGASAAHADLEAGRNHGKIVLLP